MSLNFGCWVPWLFLPVLFLVVCLIASILAATLSCDFIKSMISVFVVSIVVFGFCLLVSLFAIRVVIETRTFAVKLQPAVEDIISDPKWREYAHELGIHADAIPKYALALRQYASDWLEKEGYNSTLISQTITEYA